MQEEQQAPPRQCLSNSKSAGQQQQQQQPNDDGMNVGLESSKEHTTHQSSIEAEIESNESRQAFSRLCSVAERRRTLVRFLANKSEFTLGLAQHSASAGPETEEVVGIK